MSTNSANAVVAQPRPEQEIVDEIDSLKQSVRDRIGNLEEKLATLPIEQIALLRKALESAKAKIVEQRDSLEQLTGPALSYATVVTVSEEPFVQKKEYKSIIGNTETFDPNIRSLGSYKLGDHVEFTTFDLRDEIKRTKKHVIVGFRKGNEVWTEHDDEFVVFSYLDDFPRIAEVVKSPDSAVVIAVDGKFFEVLCPREIKVAPGDTVTVSPQTMQIVGLAKTQAGGDIAYVRRVIDKTFSEVDHQSSVRIVFNGKFADTIEKGDRVVMDSGAMVVVRNLGKEDERFSFTAETNVTWEDIGGLQEAKQEMIEAVELPHKRPDVFRFYGKRPVKGVLLYGPPGCGKTMLGKATATALAKIYDGNAKSAGFIYIKGPEILDRYVGVAEATIRQIFQRARKHKEEHGYPAVIFIDEADAILAKRGSGVSSDMERTIVPMFLTEMDGLEESGALVILATNRSDILDPAVVRDGRIDRKVKVTRPTKESAAEIFLLNLKGVPLNNGYTQQGLAKLGAEQVFSEKRVLYEIATHSKGTCKFTLGNIVNGGMIASIVDQATSIALRRDLSQSKDPEGLRKKDLLEAVDLVERQNRDLNHQDELSEFVHDFREDVVSIQRLRQSH